LIGSGASEQTLQRLSLACDGVIAGTALKRNGLISAPVDADRVSALKRLLPQSAQPQPLP